MRDITQASVYGKCIVADYNSVHKDKCLTEFLRLKECYVVSCPISRHVILFILVEFIIMKIFRN